MAFETEEQAIDALRERVQDFDLMDGQDYDFFVEGIHEDEDFAPWLATEDDLDTVVHDFHFKSGRVFDMVVRLEEDTP